MQPILTLNARDNVMLEVTRDYFKLSNPIVRRVIQELHLATIGALASKRISYADLRSGLVPSAARHEVGLIFNSQCIESSGFGFVVARAVLPLLDKRTTQSVLCGDLLGRDQDLIFSILEESLVLSRSLEFVHGTALFCVYINNLSDAAMRKLHSKLVEFRAYAGYIPATFASRAKSYLSTTLAPSFLKNGPRVIMGHEDDRPNEENVNVSGFPFEEFGYEVFSLQSRYFDIFLGYKIECVVSDGFEVDTQMGLNAISDHVMPLEECTVLLEDAKHTYLLSHKAGKLNKAGIAGFERLDLAELIKSKIAASYIYNLVYLEEHDVIKFNLMLEVARRDGGHPTKMTAVLEYRPEQKSVRVITLH